MRQNPIRRPMSALAPILTVCLVLTGGVLTGGVLTGCATVSQSKYNPFNWFKSATSTEVPVLYQAPPDQRLLVAQVTALKIEQTPDGAILRATGLPPSQGWWKAALVKVDQDDAARLVYEFRLYPPLAPAPASTPRSREITVAVALSNQQLQGISTITVQGEGNALSSRR